MDTFTEQIIRVTKSPHDFSFRQIAVLLVCSKIELAINRQLHLIAGRLSFSNPVLSRAADRLEEAGYVVRSKLHGDRRQVVLTVTDAGRAFIAQIMGGSA